MQIDKLKNERLKLIRKTFRKYFGDTDYSELPKELKVGEVGEIEIPQIGGLWTGNYRLYKDKEYYLDFFASHRQTNSQHQRIHENGELESLENYWEFGYTVYKDAPERTEREKNEMMIKNRKVNEILRNKGFE